MQLLAEKLPQQIKTMAALLESAGAPLYLVGGAVRDALMGIAPHDWDVCGPLVPQQMLLACKQAGITPITRSSELGTMLLRHEGMELEYTPFREERYAQGGAHRPQQVMLGVSLQQDALRRDFTVGAIYYRIHTRELTDPLGGRQAITDKILRMCAPDTFKADGLRVLRLVRQAAELGFSPDEQTLMCAKSASSLLGDIVPERRQTEFTRILLADTKRQGGTRDGLLLLSDIGVWLYLAPQLLEGVAIAQRAQYHAYDVFTHNLSVCIQTPPTLEMRLAGLLHDVAKPLALRTGGRMLGHDKLGEAMAGELLGQQGLKYPTSLVQHVQKLIRTHMFDLDGRAKDSTVRMKFARWGQDFVPQWIALREADVRGSGREAVTWQSDKHRRLWQKMCSDGTPLSLKALAISGADLIDAGITGREVGFILDALWMEAARRPSLNRKPALLGRARTLHNEQRFAGDLLDRHE